MSHNFEVKFNFLCNHWTKFYNPGVVLEAHGNVRRMAMDTGGLAQNPVNVFGIMLWHQVVTLDNIGDARSEPA
jgi:hypothetical protein